MKRHYVQRTISGWKMLNKPKSGETPLVQGVRTWQIVLDADGYHEGEIKDWPAYLQDKIYMALEKLAKQVSLPVVIVYSGFHNNDHASEAHKETHPYFMWIVASEVVIKDVGLQDRVAQAAKELVDRSIH